MFIIQLIKGVNIEINFLLINTKVIAIILSKSTLYVSNKSLYFSNIFPLI